METLVQSTLAAPEGDISFFSLFWQAHIVVKIVMVGLLAASVWCWAIIVDKVMLIGRTRRQMSRFETVFWSGQSLEELYGTAAQPGEPLHGRAVCCCHARMETQLTRTAACDRVAAAAASTA